MKHFTAHLGLAVGVLLGSAVWARAEQGSFARTASEIRISLKRALEAIEQSYGERYDGDGFLKRLDALRPDDQVGHEALQREALLANPTLDFKHLLIIDRKHEKKGAEAAFPGGNFSSLANSTRNGWRGGIYVIENVFSDSPKRRPLWEPPHGGNVSDVDLHFDGDRILFAMARAKDFAYRLYEMKLDEHEPREGSVEDGGDVDHFDPLYLPDGAIIFASTATFLGMPCINGGPRMASLYRMEKDRRTVRQLGFDQDTSWYPTLMHDGRVMYTRWDYSDMVHSSNRPLMQMRPDGTNQRSIAFSNSYFPTSFFFARPIPGHPTQNVGIITGHHGPARVGRMVVHDPAISGYEHYGMVRELPGYGRTVERMVKDPLVAGVWPQLIHPYPLAESESNRGAGAFFLVSMKPSAKERFGIYLVDIYDNAVLLYRDEHGMEPFEPLPIKQRPAPPIVPSRVKPESSVATLYIQDIYEGPGLKGVPRGTVKQLRIGSYQFSANGNGGHQGTIGTDSGWDIKTIVGVTPVNEDGSVSALIPAKQPLFFHPLDAQGRILQGMRTWSSAQGGEVLSCIGCHEPSSQVPRPRPTLASKKKPEPLSPWLGEERPMSFAHEIQPILDLRCVSCHDGKPANGRYEVMRREHQNNTISDLRPTPTTDYAGIRNGGTAAPSYGGRFTEAYMTLHNVVRHPGIESPMAVPNPGEYGALVSELTQILEKGHYGVELSKIEWLKLNTWMDYNAPFHGYRRQIVAGPGYRNGASQIENAFKRGNELSRLYAGLDNFTHLEPPPAPRGELGPAPDQKSWKQLMEKGRKEFAYTANKDRPQNRALDVGAGHRIELVGIPSGSFVMGSASETPRELPMHETTIGEPFWMSKYEITNQQLRLFAKDHNSGFEDRLGYQYGFEGVPVNGDDLPAVRVSWQTAMAFCEWLSRKTGYRVTLPSEAQWEFAARAGAGTPFWFGELNDNFSACANLSDETMLEFAENTAASGYTKIVINKNPNRYEMWIPYIKGVNDGSRVQVAPGKYKPNPYGLCDMHGNVAEWTRSEYRAYPFADAPAGSGDEPHIRRVVRGGSYRDRPYRATASYRLGYQAWQQVHDVGFRIMVQPGTASTDGGR